MLGHGGFHFLGIPWKASPCCALTRDKNPLPAKRDGEKQSLASQWMWVTTLPKEKVQTKTFIEIAHKRWDIENKAFNELDAYWRANHVYKHTAKAIEAFWLVTVIAYNLFHAFISLNLKPAIINSYTKLHLARSLTAVLCRSCRSP